jgi:hypothetical protein
MVEVVNIGRTYLALLDTSYQGAHLGAQGTIRFTDANIKDLITQDLTNKGLDNANLVQVFITRGKMVGGSISNYTVVPMKTSTVTPTPSSKQVIENRLSGSNPPDGRFVAVEIVYNYRLLFPWPKIKGLLSDPFPLRAYTIQYSQRQ